MGDCTNAGECRGLVDELNRAVKMRDGFRLRSGCDGSEGNQWN